jgi:hypothetical protein
MKMSAGQWWKNFSLVKELDIAGSFIYNGLRSLHEMDSLHYESEVFEVLYGLSVGVERLLKICVILLEHDSAVDQEAFEKSLITHTHSDLARRIQEKHDLGLTAPYNEFLSLLGEFYKTHRYGRYGMEMAIGGKSEKTLLTTYLEKQLQTKFCDNAPFDITKLDKRCRKCLGKRVGTLCEKLYEVINKEASRLNIFTYELRNSSKASRIFLRKKYDFYDDDVLLKELLIFLIHSDPEHEHAGVLRLIQNIEPLDFDPGMLQEYIASFGSRVATEEILDELEHHYSDVANVGERLDCVDAIGNPNVFFNSGEDD